MAASKSKIRIGVLGLTHDHVWDNLKDLAKSRDAKLVAVADPNEPLLERAAKEYGCAIHADYEIMIESEKLDAVYIFSDNAEGLELIECAADAGLDILIEKPMAESLGSADDALAVIRSSGVRCMVNWPITWWPQLQKALDMAASGEIGKLWQVKYRAAHNGPREMGCSPYFYEWLYDPILNGGGAFVDYCCYGAVLSRLLLGMPSRVSGTAGRLCKEDITVEDNGVLVMTYPGAISIAEASWTQIGYFNTYSPLILGTEGSLLVEPNPDGRLLLATKKNPQGKQVKVPRQPAYMANATNHFIHCLKTGEDFHPMGDPRICRDAQEIVEAGVLSAQDGAEMSLPLSLI